MAARLTRAKRKISVAGIPMRIPPREQIPSRVDAVLAVVYQLFTAGHTAPSGPTLQRRDLADEAIRLARVLGSLVPDAPRVDALLALMLSINARRESRIGPDGRAVDLANQDRSLWDGGLIAEARQILTGLPASAASDSYALQAEIALAHASSPSFEATDWVHIVHIYDRLLVVDPSPVTALNRAVALGLMGEPRQALAEVEALEVSGQLATYPYVAVVKADLLWKLGEWDAAQVHLRDAIDQTANDAERDHLTRVFTERSINVSH
jgi:RNA polymerase sigma-70 factor (ECF subfamily)